MVDAVTIANTGFKLSVDKIKNFKVRPDDIFLLTFPKSGTTWMKEILPLVMNGGDIDAITGTPRDVLVPYLEFQLSADDDPVMRGIQKQMLIPDGFALDQLQSPRLLSSHLRSEFLPRDIDDKRVKVIYLSRNPKDVAISSYYFLKAMQSSGIVASNESSQAKAKAYQFNEFFPEFLEMKGRTHKVHHDGTKWHEHVLPWWEKRYDRNVLFLKYEDMIRDLKSCVRQIANFLNVPLSDRALDKISDHCSFQSMKNNQMALRSNYCTNVLGVKAEEGSPFVRIGGVGGWKNTFTVAQNEMFDEIYQEWIRGSDIEMTFGL
ncbi:sulfotransferase 1E1-like [Ptychodera flava]|uniref:sulfotransferase 1E1-like n=1 Tax=Ptychodera flava TaxID=63121 RepID=UPI003969E519